MLKDMYYRSAQIPKCHILGDVAEWTKAADCKSAGLRLRRFESCHPHHMNFKNIISKMDGTPTPLLNVRFAGVAQLARASAFQAEGRGFESRLPLQGPRAHVAQSVEHILGKDEVSGSSPLVGSTTVVTIG